MSELVDVLLVVKNIVKCCPFGEISLIELEKQFQALEGVSLAVVAGDFGFDRILSMIKSWPQLVSTGSGLNTKIRCLETNHITELNRHSKKSKTKNYRPPHGEASIPRRFHGKDPYAFSSDDSSADNYNAMSTCDDRKPKVLQSSVEPAGPTLIKDTQTFIPPPVALETVQDFSEKFLIALTDSANPHRFWFTPYSNCRKLNDLNMQMTAFYSANKAYKIDEADIQEGLVVAASFGALWNRAKIIGKSGKFVRLFFVDYGSVEDVVADDRVRYLREDFAQLPAFALRGVLSHVQPSDGVWSDECIKFFLSELVDKTLEAKIFKKNIEDSSYSMAIKAKIGEDKTKQLVTSALIAKKFCIFDEKFLEKAVVNEAEGTFSDLEGGKYLKLSKIAAEEPEENWLPSPMAVENVVAQSAAESSAKKYSTLKLPSPSSKNGSPSRRLQSRLENVSPSSASGLSEISTASTADAYSEMRRIPEQDMNGLKVGALMKVYIHAFNDLDQLFFYRKDEFIDIRSFLKTFNEVYSLIRKELNEDFAIGNFAVTFADENYCRAQIIEELSDGESFKVFLLDFGTFVERGKAEIFKLHKDFMKRQAAVYSGRLSNIPEHVHIKTREDLLKIVSSRFVNVKILRIDGKFAELLLIDQ